MAPAASAGVFVLVVDDDEIMRELLTALLESAGHRVAIAESAGKGLEAVQQHTGDLDIVLTDLRMPDTDAIAALKKLRAAMSAEMRLLGMSGSPAEPVELELMDGFLLKPFDLDDFAVTVERARAGAPLSSPVFDSSPTRNAPVLDRETYDRMAKSLPAKALRELYELTLDDVGKRTDAIRQAADEGDSSTCKSEAHAMKGGCGMVGAMELRAIAADIEAGSPVNTSVLGEITAAADRLRRMLDTLP